MGTEEIDGNAQTLNPPSSSSRELNSTAHNVQTAPIADIVVRPTSQRSPTHGLRHPVEGRPAALEGTQGTAGEPLESRLEANLTKDFC